MKRYWEVTYWYVGQNGNPYWGSTRITTNSISGGKTAMINKEMTKKQILDSDPTMKYLSIASVFEMTKEDFDFYYLSLENQNKLMHERFPDPKDKVVIVPVEETEKK